LRSFLAKTGPRRILLISFACASVIGLSLTPTGQNTSRATSGRSASIPVKKLLSIDGMSELAPLRNVGYANVNNRSESWRKQLLIPITG
jgi:hypothetical protein